MSEKEENRKAKLEIMEAYFTRMARRAGFLVELDKDGHTEEALLLCCCYIERWGTICTGERTLGGKCIERSRPDPGHLWPPLCAYLKSPFLETKMRPNPPVTKCLFLVEYGQQEVLWHICPKLLRMKLAKDNCKRIQEIGKTLVAVLTHGELSVRAREGESQKLCAYLKRIWPTRSALAHLSEATTDEACKG